MNSINKFISIEEQIENLEKKGLIFKTKRSKDIFYEYLREYNYELLINGYWFEDFYEEDGINFSNKICSDDIRYIFDIDRTISSILWKYFKGIELHFNSTISHVLCFAFETYGIPPYVVLLNEKYSKDIFGNYSKSKKRKNIQYDNIEIKKYLLKFIKRNQILNQISKYNINNEFDETKEKIYKKIKYIPDHSNEKKYAFVDIKSLSFSWTFSSLVWIYEVLSDKFQKKVREEFFKSTNNDNIDIDNEGFLEIIKIFSDFRNSLAHNSKIINFKLNIKSQKLAKKISSILNINLNIDDSYNLNYFIKIIEQIRGIKDERIKKEIKKYIDDKFNNSSESKNDVIKNILYKNLGIKL